MRVTPISYSHSYALRKNHSKKEQPTQTPTVEVPTFKGWKAPVGGTLGALAGLGLGTLLSGGLLAPALLMMGGTAAGAIYGDTKDDHFSDEDCFDDDDY